jgi:putative CocE/NonD family hydrolase
MNVPCFTIGSWFDFMNVGSIASFRGRQHHGDSNSRGRQWLLIGPWLHGGYLGKNSNKVGELTLPETAKFDAEQHLVRWFDHWLKGADNGIERDPAVRYFSLGAAGEASAPGNVWREAADWPIPSEAISYFLHPDQTLSTSAPPEEHGEVSFLADPLHPNEIPGRAFPGAADARTFESQAEVRCFTTEPLSHPVEWIGLIRAELFVTSTARDTDFLVRVSDVYPDGRSILLVDSIRRARYREGYERELLLTPGEIAKVAFDIGWISQIFAPGHRIRVTVASTGAPFYEPNPNTGEALSMEFPEHAVVARNTVQLNSRHASRVIAPMAVR